MSRRSSEEDPGSNIGETSTHGSTSMQENGSTIGLSERQSQEEEGEPRNLSDEAPNYIETAMSTQHVCNGE
jgi:hypothetical protein